MNLRHLKVFVSVYEHMNVTHAARALYMTQPVVSRTIGELEEAYGQAFFKRLNNRLEPTGAGKRMYHLACQVLSSVNAMEKEMLQNKTGFVVRVGSTYTLASYLLPKVIKRFEALYPQGRLQAQVYNASRLKEFLHQGQLDFAILEDEPRDPNLNSEIFHQDQLVLALPVGHPLAECQALTMKDLDNVPMLVRDKGSAGRRRVDEAFERHSVTLNILMESCAIQAITQAVSEGWGATLLPWQLVEKDVASGRVVTRPVTDESFRRNHYIVWGKNRVLTDPICQTMQLCRQIANETQQEASAAGESVKTHCENPASSACGD